MYEIKRSISNAPGANGTCELLVTVTSDGRTFHLNSGCFISPVYFIRDQINLFYKRPSNKEELESLKTVRYEFEKFFGRVQNIVRVSYGYVTISKDWILNVFDQVNTGKIFLKGEWISFDSIMYAAGQEVEQHYRIKDCRNLYDYFPQYLMSRKRSGYTCESFQVLANMLCRFELYQQLVLGNRKYSLCIDTISSDTIESFRSYSRTEGELYQKYEEKFKRVIELAQLRMPRLKPAPIANRSANQMIAHLRQLKAVCKFLIYEERETDNFPFENVEIGDYDMNRQPICLNKSEILAIKHHTFEEGSVLSVQRDIFIFQCVSGCRYRDMICLTEANIKEKALSYKPIPTVKENLPAVPFAQLDQWCCDAVARHRGEDWRNRLFPFFSKRRYEAFVRMILKQCNIDRLVFVHNPKGKEDAKPLYEVADSKLAVQTFWYGHGFENHSVDEVQPTSAIKNVIINSQNLKPNRKPSVQHRGIDDSLLKAALTTIE